MMFLFESEPVTSKPWFIILMAVLISIAAAGILVLLAVFFMHSRAKRRVKDLKDEYSSIHASFTNDCRTMINRIETISHHNATYVEIFNNDNDRYSEIYDDYDSECQKSINKLDALVAKKDYKSLTKASEETKKILNEYKNKAGLLASELTSMLRPENDANAQVVSLREKFRSLKERHDEHQTELASLDDSFSTLFAAITDYFQKIDNCLNSADYDGAKALMPKADQLISEASKVMNDLPYLNTLCDKVIPNRIEELKGAKQKMDNENYPLQHLKLNEAIAGMESNLAACKKQLQMLSVKGVRETLTSISQEINSFMQAFEKEKTSKEEFLQKEEGLNDSTFQCEQQYSTLMNRLPEYQKIYCIDKSYLDQLKNVGALIEDMSRRKRFLDTYATSNTPLPYSSLVAQMEALEKKVAEIQRDFLDFENYLKGLRSDADRAYQFIRDSFVTLKKQEVVLREANIVSFTNVEQPKIHKAYGMLSDLDKVLQITPINVQNVNFKWKEIDTYINNLVGEITRTYKDMVAAENLIVYDNKFRMEDTEVQNDLKVVEASFYEGDFPRASSVAIKIYRDSKGDDEVRKA